MREGEPGFECICDGILKNTPFVLDCMMQKIRARRWWFLKHGGTVMKETGEMGTTSDQDFYDKEPVGSLVAHANWMREIEFYFDAYAARLDNALIGTSGNAAELGAGSCGLSVCLSRLPSVKQVVALDISMVRMKRMIELSASVLDGNSKKITPIASDFNGRLPFADGELDVIVFDAALHHAQSMWRTLSECRRVLKKGGLLIAQREAYLSPYRAKWQINKLLRSPEVAANVSENIYLKEQYIYYLTVQGFDVEFMPRSKSSIKNILSLFNGTLYSDGVLYSRKK